jgi:hypothetical protein
MTEREAVRYLRARGYEIRLHGLILGPDMDELARRYRAGEGLDQLAADFGASSLAVRNALHRAGVTLRPQGRGPGIRQPNRNHKFDWQEARRRRAAGQTLKAIGAALGVAPSTVHAALCKMDERDASR